MRRNRSQQLANSERKNDVHRKLEEALSLTCDTSSRKQCCHLFGASTANENESELKRVSESLKGHLLLSPFYNCEMTPL